MNSNGSMVKQKLVMAGLVGWIGLGFAGPVQADDVGDKFVVSGILGPTFPVSPKGLTSAANTAGLDLGAQIGMQMSPWLGIGLSYEYISLGNGMHVAPLNALFLFRMMTESHWSPNFLVGGGVARTTTTNRYENSSFKAGLGLDYFFAPDFAFGPHLDYYLLSHSGGATPQKGHLIGLNAVFSYFFGSTSGGH
jgi:hypothetical protein